MGKSNLYKNYDKTLLFLWTALLLVFVISFNLGKYPITTGELLSILFARAVEGIREMLSVFGNLATAIPEWSQNWSRQQEVILFNVRMPRILLSIMVGAVLSLAGASYQGVFRNPLASSDIIGASSGAAFGAALAILRGQSGSMITLSAFIFSIVAVVLVMILGTKVKSNKILGLVLAGIMVSSLFNSGTSFLKLVADPNNELPAITYWLMGSFSGSKLRDVSFAFWPMLIGTIPLLLMRWQINLLTMGDEEAKTMGVNVNIIRIVIIACSTLVTAASIAVSGMIGWISLVIPHFSRMLVGSDYRRLLPTSLIMGGLFLLIVDNVSRLALSSEIPIGILTSFIGAPFYFYLILREGGKI